MGTCAEAWHNSCRVFFRITIELALLMALEKKASFFTIPLSSLPTHVRIALFVAADFLFVWLDIVTGPFIPLTVLYIALIYVGITRVDRSSAYIVALISAIGRTYVATTILPRHS